MKKQLKADLFRFITLRSPQLITKERRQLGFVEHPNHAESYFLKEIISETNLATAKQKLQAVVGGFTPFQSVEAVKQFAGDLWAFSMWLGKFKNELTDSSDLNNRIQQSLNLSTTDALQVWDNVFYDILVQKNPYVRQACLQLLVAIHFLEHYSDHTHDLVQLRRIANGKVVVPTAFSNKHAVAMTTTNPGGIAHRSDDAPQQEFITQYTGQAHAIKLQGQYHNKMLAEQAIRELQHLKETFLDLEERYQDDYDEAYEEAQGKYVKESKERLAEYLKEIGKTEADFTDHEEDQNDTIPDHILPSFEFEYPLPLSRQYTSRRLSFNAKQFIDKHRLSKSDVSTAIQLIDEQLFAEEVNAAQLIDDKPKKIAVQGVVLKTQNSYVPTYSISTRYTSNSQGQHCMEIHLLFHTSYANASLQSGSFEVHVNTGNGVKTYTVDHADIHWQGHTQPTMLHVHLTTICFSKGEFKDTFTYAVEGNFTLDDGQHFRLNTKYVSIFGRHTGVATTVVSTSPSSAIIHYGINKIGVADYRKVEQELCCYIPGEVSHIENIMAREYKEKATRQLTRSEESIETTTEREIEEQTDTSTTTRNEIASEVAQVLTTDRGRNLGFNAGVSGSATTPVYSASFDAGVTGEFSFSQSTSNSNNIAKTYAEDVTRRALERVVQKNTVKRTSKILREFEENNKHGYDNRDGSKHVTGVFRWIDKVYKNRLVNYGKRLIYEFMIPEPSRYYKELLKIEVDNASGGANPGGGNTGGGGTPPIAPIHPKDQDPSMASASDVTYATYKTLAGFYGVSPTLPQDEFAPDSSNTKTENISNPVNTGGNTTLNAFIQVPQDYECYRIEGSVAYQWRQRSNPKGFINVSVGSGTNQSWNKPHYNHWNMRTDTIPFAFTNLNLGGMINPSVSSLKVWQYTLSLTAKFKLKNSVFQQWQQMVYDEIMAAYNQQYADYLIALDAYNQSQNPTPTPTPSTDDEDKTLQVNPLYTKQYILNELKRLCIEMMFKPFNMQLGKDFYQGETCKVPNLKLGPELDRYASTVKFFEQAFDWRILSQVFYPYYWADRCDWKELFQSQDASDHILQAFLQSGMARVFVPVREGFEEAVIYFLETGEVWQGTGLVIDSDDELYLSIVDETTYVDGAVEEEWETIVPTSLTIIQEGSALLNDDGLPCCEEDGENLIEPDKNILQLLEEKG
ncbi:MAG: hypothetical protein ACPGJS_09330 [Flammeovirgaceae bacterium]